MPRTRAMGPAHPSDQPSATKLKVKRKPKKVLQDITHQFPHSPSPRKPSKANFVRGPDVQSDLDFTAVSELEPVSRALFTSVHLSPVANERRPRVYPSSLPPSSPPPASGLSDDKGFYLDPEQDEENLQRVPGAHDSERDHGHDENENIFVPRSRSPAHGRVLVPDSDAPPVPHPPSDPFGFFALEQKLKARPRQPLRVLTRPAVPGGVGPIQRAPRTPPTPRTPHKPKRRRVIQEEMGARDVAGRQGVDIDVESELPSTPSPAKPHRRQVHVDQTRREGGSEAGDRLGDVQVEGSKTWKGKARARAAEEDDEDGSEDLTIDPKKIAKELEALLPRRPMRRGTGRLKVKRSIESGDEDEVERRKRKTRAKNAGTSKGKQAVKPSIKKNGGQARGEEFKFEDAEEEKRRERIAYFKRLEGYQVEHEDVFVV